MNVTYSEEPMKRDKFGHRTADWSDQVQKGVQELGVSFSFLFYFGVIDGLTGGWSV